MLDATKAFDKVSFTKLFALLLKRDIPAIILRVVLDLYTRQSVAASWNGCTSNPFSVTNGVRQGGVLSPIFFNVYMDELIDKLKMNDVGRHIGRQFTGAFCYADDLTLLSPTIRGLQKMLNVCDDFANEYSVKFNARKTVCMCFSRKPTRRDINVLLSGEELLWSNHVKHLGNTLSHNLSDEIDVQVKRGHFYGFVNTLCAKFKCVLGDINLATKLFMSYCCSFYGSQLWISAHIAALSMVVNCGISAPPGLTLFVLLGIKLYVAFSSCRTILIASCYLMLLMVILSDIGYWSVVWNFMNHVTKAKTAQFSCWCLMPTSKIPQWELIWDILQCIRSLR